MKVCFSAFELNFGLIASHDSSNLKLCDLKQKRYKVAEEGITLKEVIRMPVFYMLMFMGYLNALGPGLCLMFYKVCNKNKKVKKQQRTRIKASPA
jgi:hypothetical protein